MRVFLTGAYKNGTGRGQRREWNWVLGVAMLLATLFLSFTGYLLPWDQLAYWAVTVGTNIASSIPFAGAAIRELLIGGRTIDQPTLIRFYVLHVLVLPAALGAFFAYHMWRVRKDGGLARADREALLREKTEEPPAKTKTYTLLGVARGTAPAIRSTTLEAPDLMVNAVPDLTRRAATAVLGTIAAISILSTLVRSPLEEAANALVTPNPAKAPWYFLWLQEIVTDTTVPHRLLHRERRVPRRRAPAGPPGRGPDLVALARQEPRVGDRGLVREDPAQAEPRLPGALPRRRRLHPDRDLLPRSLLALLLALADLARDAHEDLRMEKRTDSPYSRLDRPVLAVVGVLLVVSTVLFARNDREHEWRYYQAQFRSQVAEKFGAEKAKTVRRPACSRSGSRPSATPIAASPATRPRVEGLRDGRRALPHASGGAPEDASLPRSSAAPPATAARDGPSTPTPAHGPVEHWEEPLLGQAHGRGVLRSSTTRSALMQMNCNVCHRYDRETRGADFINLGKKLVQQKGCRACHVINGRGGTIGPDLTYVGDKAPEQYEYGRLSGQKTSFAWHVAHLKDPRALVQDTVMPNFHLTTKEAQALAILVMSWRKAPVPAEFVAGVPRTDPQTADEKADGTADEGGPGSLVRQDRLLRVPLDLGARRQEPGADRTRSLDRRRGHAVALRSHRGRLPARADREPCQWCCRGRSS